MRHPRFFLVLSCSLSLACAASRGSGQISLAPDEGPPLPPRFEAAAVDAYVAGQLRERAIVGASLAIVRNGEIALARAYGVRSLDGGEPVTTSTPFAVGSITKQFTCTAALLLADEGRLSLDDEVAAHYPKLTRAADVTLDDLGSHLAGYPDFYPLDFMDRRMATPIEPDELIRRYAGLPLDFEPRSRFSYSNTGFVVLGRVVEKVSGGPLGDLLEQRVFAPLGMEHAVFEPKTTTPGLARGHTSVLLGEPERAPPEAAGWIHAAGALYASATDLARWDLALIESRLLSPDSMRRLTSPRTLQNGRSTEYGCGLSTRVIEGERVLAHSGAVNGFLAFNAVVPRTRAAVALLVNSDYGEPGEIHQALLHLLLAEAAAIPEVAGPPAVDVARRLVRELQRGELDRRGLGEELSAYLSESRVRAAAPRLSALGEPTAIEVGDRWERGGMEVTLLWLSFPARVVKALLYRKPDGTVEQFLLVR